jgi:hypothetical protein
VDDPYCHDEFCKDNPRTNDEAKLKVAGTTKFELAYSQAIKLSADMLKRLKAELTPAQWAALIGL